MKAFEDNNLDIVQVMKYVFDRVENILGKGENAGYQHFLLFPTIFSEDYIFSVLKVWIVRLMNKVKIV